MTDATMVSAFRVPRVSGWRAFGWFSFFVLIASQLTAILISPGYVIGLRLRAIAFLFVMIYFIRCRSDAALLERSITDAIEDMALGQPA